MEGSEVDSEFILSRSESFEEIILDVRDDDPEIQVLRRRDCDSSPLLMESPDILAFDRWPSMDLKSRRSPWSSRWRNKWTSFVSFCLCNNGKDRVPTKRQESDPKIKIPVMDPTSSDYDIERGPAQLQVSDQKMKPVEDPTPSDYDNDGIPTERLISDQNTSLDPTPREHDQPLERREMNPHGNFGPDNNAQVQQRLRITKTVPAPVKLSSSMAAEMKPMWKWLEDNKVEFIEIHGKLGMGNTWTTKRVMDSVRESYRFDEVIWVDIAKKHCNRRNMLTQIAAQLKLTSTIEVEGNQTTGYEKQLKLKIAKFLDDKRFLLILHDMRLFFWTDLKELGIPRPLKKLSKVLITGLERISFAETADRSILLNGLGFDQAWSLLCEKSEMDYDSPPHINSLAKELIKNFDMGPLGILILAGALRHLSKVKDYVLITKHLKKIEELRNAFTMKKVCYEMLPSRLKACFLYCTYYIEYDCMSVKGLIASWMVEGFLDGFDCIDEAYSEGNRIVQELVDRYLLCKKDDNHVLMQNALRDRQHYNLDKGSDLILAYPELFVDGEKINLMDGQLQPIYYESEGTMPSSLVIHGNEGRLPGQLSNIIFNERQDLEVVAILHAGIECLPTSLSNLHKLRILVLRDCPSLQEVNHIESLKKLEVLSISGTCNLIDIPDNLFMHLTKLKTLSLSITEIDHLPSSLSNLWRLEFLILKGCSKLKLLPPLEELSSLIMLDLSECVAFKGIQEKKFGRKYDLHTVNLSRTKVVELSFLYRCINLRTLVLRDCFELKTLPDLKGLKFLTVMRD